GKVVVEPVVMAADVGNTGVEAKGFDDVEAVVPIDAETNGIGQHWLGGEETDLQPGGNTDALDRSLWFGRGPRGLGLVGFVSLDRGATKGEAKCREQGNKAKWVHEILYGEQHKGSSPLSLGLVLLLPV